MRNKATKSAKSAVPQGKQKVHKRWKKAQFFLGLALNVSLISGLYVLVSNHIQSNKPREELTSTVPENLQDYYIREAKKYGLPPYIVAAVGLQESRYRTDVCSEAGACGVAQFMPATARRFNVEVYNPASSIRGSAEYLAFLYKMFNRNTGLMLAAYNAGEGRVKNWILAGSPYTGPKALKPETINYVKSITGMSLQGWMGQVKDVDELLEKHIDVDGRDQISRVKGFDANRSEAPKLIPVKR